MLEVTLVRNKVNSVTAKLSQDEQYRISLECKRNSTKFWQYVKRKSI